MDNFLSLLETHSRLDSMASLFTIYSINQISDLIYHISYIIYKISDILYQIIFINKISDMSQDILYAI